MLTQGHMPVFSRSVVPDSPQVELDHARLAMLAVLLSGAVGAGAGAGAGVYLNAHDGFSAVRLFSCCAIQNLCVASFET